MLTPDGTTRRSRTIFAVNLLSAVSVILLLAGCGSAAGNGPAVAPTVTVSVSPTSIAAGTASTLTVAATNATTVTISGSDGSSYTLPATGGTQNVTPTATVTYTITASGPGGTATATATVTVSSSGPPAPTVTISANPTSIAAGTASTLTVAATNATTVTISGSDGSSYTLPAAGGTQTVTPSTTVTYTVTATGAGGTATAKATVTVTATTTQPAPTVTVSAKPTSIAAGTASTLTVAATNATTVTISGSDGSSYTLPAAGGMQSVTPTATVTYTVTATGPGGTATATATVTVTATTTQPAPTVTISATPTSIAPGAASTLTVAATNATTVIISGSDGSSYTLPAAGGMQSVTPKSNTTYTVTATGPGGKATAAAAVTVVAPPTVTITAKPLSIASGSSSTLTVSASDDTSLTLTGTDGSSYPIGAGGGAVTVSPTTTTTYTATATGAGGTTSANVTVDVTPAQTPTVTIEANPSTIVSGSSSTLTVTATNATTVTVSGSDGTTYTLQATGGTQTVTPTSTTTYTANASGDGTTQSATATVTVTAPGSVDAINHVIFMLQENHTFDNYFGMLNPYRKANGWDIGSDGKEYDVDGIDDKLNTISNTDDQGDVYPLFKFTSTCVDDMSSDWLSSYGDVGMYNSTVNRTMTMGGFVHDAEGYANYCASDKTCSGSFTDLTGERAMGYYDQGFLNYYYYMASQFALSDRWFSPVSSKSIDNRIATFTGGTTQGLTKDPGNDDHLTQQLDINNIFEELDQSNVSWKIYYTVTQGFCLDYDDCPSTANSRYPATDFSSLAYSFQYMYNNPSGAPCKAPTVASSVIGDTTNSFCIDPTHIAPIQDPKYGYFADLSNGTLPSFAFIEAGYGHNDEHPGSEQPILNGQAEVASIINAFMASSSWKDSVFFLSYDEGGGPYDHVPPVPGHSNDYTDAMVGSTPVADIPDISTIAVNPDQYYPCVPPDGTPTVHCDLLSTDPGAASDDAAHVQGFAAQLGFRLPNMVVSPFSRMHYVSHIPMDHTAVIKFVENRFIGPNAHLTARDAAQPNLLDFFNFTDPPWETPPTPPTPVSDPSGTYCTPANFAP